MAVRTSEEFKKVHIQSEEFNGLIGTFAGDLIQKKVGGRKGEVLGTLANNILSSPKHNSTSKSAELANLLSSLLNKGSKDKSRPSKSDENDTSYPTNIPTSPYSNSAYPAQNHPTGYPSQNYNAYSNIGDPQAGYFPSSAGGYNPPASNYGTNVSNSGPRPIGFIMPGNEGPFYPGNQPNYGASGATNYPSAYPDASSPYSSVPTNNSSYNPNVADPSTRSQQLTGYIPGGGYGYERDIGQVRHQEEQGRHGQSIGGRIEGMIDRFAKSSVKEGGSFNVRDIVGGAISSGGSNVEHLIGSLIGGGGDRGKYNGGGSNIKPDQTFKGGMVEIVGNLIGEAAHRFLGVNPITGKIIGSIAGNVLFNLGGKDNTLGNIGKVVLDNIVTGKFHRKVDPYLKPQPSPTPGEPVRVGHAQHFHDLRNRCLRERRLFEDNEFPANDQSLYYSKRPSVRIEWLRPGQIIHDPQLIAEGHSRFDVIQGELGNCWFMAAAANLTLRDELFYRVVPPDQSFTDNYAGIFHFQFWQYGHWVDVVIDDRLPTYNGKLVYMHSRDNNEFWSALLERPMPN
uniref:Calpain catalytic domain-containing protein n=1 Tax=Ditylenchus dipsaci TaxID=166011 RepID=A0A915CZ70_9BILA